jgi:hypothetical protein
MHAVAKQNDPCPMCETPLRSMRCVPCHGTGQRFLFRCTTCAGTGKMRGCPNFFSHPGLGPQGWLMRKRGSEVMSSA